MSTINTTNIESISGGTPNFSQGLTIGSTNIASLVTMTEYYNQVSEPASPANGAVWWDGTDMRQYVGSQWIIITLTAPPLYLGDVAIMRASVHVDDRPQANQQTINISTIGNATNFGDLSDNIIRSRAGAASNRTIGVFAGGSNTEFVDGGYTSTTTDNIDYFTFASLGNATDFGLGLETMFDLAGMSDGTYGVFGPLDGFFTYEIVYITFATPGNASDFGDSTSARRYAGACSDGSRGVMAGGSSFSVENTIDYITIATPGNATDFGDLTQATRYLAGCSDTTRGLFGGGQDSSSVTTDTISYITIQTTGNSTDFGDLTVARYYLMAASNETRAVFMGGIMSGSPDNVIDYVTIQTLGNASDFGDLTSSVNLQGSATSGG